MSSAHDGSPSPRSLHLGELAVGHAGEEPVVAPAQHRSVRVERARHVGADGDLHELALRRHPRGLPEAVVPPAPARHRAVRAQSAPMGTAAARTGPAEDLSPTPARTPRRQAELRTPRPSTPTRRRRAPHRCGTPTPTRPRTPHRGQSLAPRSLSSVVHLIHPAGTPRPARRRRLSVPRPATVGPPRHRTARALARVSAVRALATADAAEARALARVSAVRTGTAEHHHHHHHQHRRQPPRRDRARRAPPQQPTAATTPARPSDSSQD